jgi:hypothetical protein
MEVTPWMACSAIEHLLGILKPEMKVFEYGSGGSTIFFASRVACVISIEHDRLWHSAVLDKLQDLENKSWDLRLVPVGKKRDKKELKAYAHAIDGIQDESLDVLVVDGLTRVLCMKLGFQKIKEGGYLVLDNSNRPQYKEAKDLIKEWDRRTFFGYGPQRCNLIETTIWRKTRFKLPAFRTLS